VQDYCTECLPCLFIIVGSSCFHAVLRCLAVSRPHCFLSAEGFL
jgi:hypothetical protein